MFDITKASAVDYSTLHVKDANGQPMFADAEKEQPLEIEIYGPGSKQAMAVEARQADRNVKRMQKNDGKYTVPTADELQQEVAEDLAAITRNFRNFNYPPKPDAEGVDLFTAVYGDRKLGFIAKQVQKHYADWGNFSPTSNGG